MNIVCNFARNLNLKMNNVNLAACPICSNLNIDDEGAFFDDLKCTLKAYQKNELIIRHGEVCDALYMLTKGSVKQK